MASSAKEMVEPEQHQAIVGVGIAFIAIGLGVTALLLFAALANCLRKRFKFNKNSSGLEIKSSARRHGPNEFVKDADFSYINIASSTNSRKKNKRAVDRSKSLERYHSLNVDNTDTLGDQTFQMRRIANDIEGPEMVDDSTSSGSVSHNSARESTPQRRVSDQFDEPQTQNMDGSPEMNVALQVQGEEEADLNSESGVSQVSQVSQELENQNLSGSTGNITTTVDEQTQLDGSYNGVSPPDILDQVHGHFPREGQGHMIEPEVKGSCTVIYIVGDNEENQHSRIDVRLSSARSLHSDSDSHNPPMPGYIDEVVEGHFEDPRLYFSHL